MPLYQCELAHPEPDPVEPPPQRVLWGVWSPHDPATWGVPAERWIVPATPEPVAVPPALSRQQRDTTQYLTPRDARDYLYGVRRALGVDTQAKLARTLGFSEERISAWLNGKGGMSRQSYDKIQRALQEAR